MQSIFLKLQFISVILVDETVVVAHSNIEYVLNSKIDPMLLK